MAITSQSVAQAVADLEANQKRVSVRSVQAITGGSTATIAKYLKPLLVPVSPNPTLDLEASVAELTAQLNQALAQLSIIKGLLPQCKPEANLKY
ncbi:hypothetical protein [Ferribacterium limneticum]|uniref:hypothetical protein n=1 Tax=Ferribacterium limneticum TaxID=76259 RepID=UPI001CF82D82|nr:hypothetical protein [Ferribacterium limneticum]UCV26775.1 hypothetical protein KI617_10680 [Ferribacterium limneticum]UCV30692.1 hypothetical protein KI608_10680 [Ferribacterium limneticum]